MNISQAFFDERNSIVDERKGIYYNSYRGSNCIFMGGLEGRSYFVQYI